MKEISLKELSWFSFTDSFDKKNQLTIWQAIAFILMKIDGFKEDTLEYMDQMDKLEKDITEENIINPQGEGYDLIEQIDVEDPSFVLEDFCLPIDEAISEMNFLDIFRRELVLSLEVPFSMVYGLLESEISKYKLGDQSSLKVTIEKYGEDNLYFFSKKELQNWKSISLLNEIGLAGAIQVSSRKIRDDKLENQKVIAGMLIHLISKQPLVDKRNQSVKFTKSEENPNINYSRIYNYFNDYFLSDECSSFPKERTVTAYLKIAYRSFKGNVNLR